MYFSASPFNSSLFSFPYGHSSCVRLLPRVTVTSILPSGIYFPRWSSGNVLHRRTIFFILFDYPPVNPVIAKASLLHGTNRHYSQYYKCEIPQWLSKYSVTIFIIRHTYFIIYHKEMHFLVLALYSHITRSHAIKWEHICRFYAWNLLFVFWTYFK